MKKQLAFILFVLFTLVLTSCKTTVPTRPEATVVVRPAAPGSNYVWVDGEWRPRNRTYIYNQGYWSAPRGSRTYRTGTWNQNKRGWYWKRGRWQ